MKLSKQRYIEQVQRWPAEGRHILAHFDDDTIVVYQAYRPQIGRYAIEHGKFGGAFSFSRMSWIKPNFLWMMYRSGWGTKPGQEITLGLRISRKFFDQILAAAVPSSFKSDQYCDTEDWRKAVAGSEVRMQWDPDHDPSGKKLPRKAIQLGLRGSVLRDFATTELVEVIDLTTFVSDQRNHICNKDKLETPTEHVYLPATAEARAAVDLADWTPPSN